jgi:hypothetical protein
VSAFVAGLDLAEGFYRTVVAPVVDRPHAACLLGEGSEVLGYDGPRSVDHSWGPRLQVFVGEADISHVKQHVNRELPERYAGLPVRFYAWQDGVFRDDRGELAAARAGAVAVRHNALHLTTELDPACGPFQVGVDNAVRPYRVLNANRFREACVEAIRDSSLRALSTVGAIDQLTHSDDTLRNFSPWPHALARTFQQLLLPSQPD